MKKILQKLIAVVCVLATLLCFAAPVAMAAASLEIRQLPGRVIYANGETLNTDGLSVVYVDEAGNEKTLAKSDYTCAPTHLVGWGSHTITVSYKGYTTTFEVYVSGEGLWPEITIKTPSSLDLQYMQSLTLTATTIQVPNGYHLQWKYTFKDGGVEHTVFAEGDKVVVTADGSTQDVVVRARLVNQKGDLLLGPDGNPLEETVTVKFHCDWYIKLLYYVKLIIEILSKLFG